MSLEKQNEQLAGEVPIAARRILAQHGVLSAMDGALAYLVGQIDINASADIPSSVVLTCLADYALTQLDDAARSNVLTRYQPAPTVAAAALPSSQEAAHPAPATAASSVGAVRRWDGSGSTLLHHATLQIGVDDQTAAAGTETTPEALASPHAIAHSASICGFNTFDLREEEKHRRAKLLHKKTKIIATIGPVSADENTITEFLQNGADSLRFNASHATRAWHQRAVEAARRAAVNVGKPNGVSLVLDSRGPEVRSGDTHESLKTSLAAKGFNVVEGQVITLSTNPSHKTAPPDETTIFVSFAQLPRFAHLGRKVVIDHGSVELFVIYVPPSAAVIGEGSTDHVKCQVITSRGRIRPFSKVHLPGWDLTAIPTLTADDRDDFVFASEVGMNAIFVSYCHAAADIVNAKKCLLDALIAKGTTPTAAEQTVQRIAWFAKIQDQEGVARVDELIKASDGIVIARQDLCADFPPKKIFTIQKYILAKTSLAGKPSVVLSQMLGSMLEDPHPNSTSCVDVSNAVVDGADGICLSDETGLGKYPVESVKALADLALEGEKYLNRPQLFQDMVALQSRPFNAEESVASGAVNTATELNAKAIIALTTTGASCRLVAKYAPGCPIIGVCKHKSTAMSMTFVKGVVPYWYEGVDTADREARLDAGRNFAVEQGFVKSGDVVVYLHADLMLRGVEGVGANVVRVSYIP